MTAGQSYKFRYRVRNIFGWSPYSDVLTVLAATKPDRPAMVTTVNVGTSVRIDWVAPYNGDSTLLYYVLVIKTKAGAFVEEPINCNARSDNTVFNNKYCVIPMDVLTSASFSLVQGDVIVAKVLAANVIGESQFSMENAIGALV